MYRAPVRLSQFRKPHDCYSFVQLGEKSILPKLFREKRQNDRYLLGVDRVRAVLATASDKILGGQSMMTFIKDAFPFCHSVQLTSCTIAVILYARHNKITPITLHPLSAASENCCKWQSNLCQVSDQ